MNDTTKTAQCITMNACMSSQISSYGYDATTQTLALQFYRKDASGQRVGGSVYHYDNVPQELYDEFCACESKGNFFGQHIKVAPSKYPYRKVS